MLQSLPQGAGLGFRRALIPELERLPLDAVDFFELAPENWIGSGPQLTRLLRRYTEQRRFVAHGLSLSIGGPGPLDRELVKQIRRFLDDHEIAHYSEHLSYCSDDGQLYDLLPIPFTEAAVHYVAERVRQVQDLLGRRIALENVSYYLTPAGEMSEADFINAVLREADCELLLDVNNVFVNAVNHRYDPYAFLREMPLERISYLHIAGHFDEAEGLLVDSHGNPVKDAVWELLSWVYEKRGALPTVLERDFNFPPLPELLEEVGRIRQHQEKLHPPRGRC